MSAIGNKVIVELDSLYDKTFKIDENGSILIDKSFPIGGWEKKN